MISVNVSSVKVTHSSEGEPSGMSFKFNSTIEGQEYSTTTGIDQVHPFFELERDYVKRSRFITYLLFVRNVHANCLLLLESSKEYIFDRFVCYKIYQVYPLQKNFKNWMRKRKPCFGVHYQ
jgi:hypothetical protein